MNTWQYILVAAIVLVGNAVAYFMGARNGKKDARRKTLLSVCENVLNPFDMIAYCNAEENEFSEEQKKAIVKHQTFLLEKFTKEVVEK